MIAKWFATKLVILTKNNKTTCLASFFLNQTDFQVIFSPLKVVNILYLNGFNSIETVSLNFQLYKLQALNIESK